MTPQIKTFPLTKLIGKKLTFTYSNYRIVDLWSSFMPKRNEIHNTISSDLYNVQINPDNFDFGPNTPFIKWAAVPVATFEFIPIGMETLKIPEGLYAVFTIKGDVSVSQKAFYFIFNEWLPNSDYELDNRPHFEILGNKYKKDDPTSEEEAWIPIKKKGR
jgi:AraC family transcriptional regulator